MNEAWGKRGKARHDSATDAVTPSTWIPRPTLRLDDRGRRAAESEIREFRKQGPRLDLNPSWRRHHPYFIGVDATREDWN